MPKKDFQNWSREKILNEYKQLIKRKKFGIVWEDRTEDVAEQCKDSLPVLKVEKDKTISGDKSDINHIFIEGDNYHALSVLNYTHKKKIDLIYIDPPYNTGNRSWKYNNHYVEKDDRYRHSKWLSFMSKRLRLAKNLLADDGIIIVTIDDYELFPLGMLMDEIFREENKLANITVLSKKSGRTTDKFFATCHEYYLVYARNYSEAKIEMFDLTPDQAAQYKYTDDVSNYKWRDFLRTGGFSTPSERPNSFYPIYFNEKTQIISVEKIDDSIEIFPIDSKGQKRVWRQTKPSLIELIKFGDIKIEKNKQGKYTVRIKDRLKTGIKPKTVWDSPKYDASSHGTKLLESILGKSRMFDFPKSIYAVIDAIEIVTRSKKDAIILDFFAGSGTTGHAVLELNKKDGGKRQFILCTDNEDNNGTGTKIAKDICYPRVRNVMAGYTSNGKRINGLGGNLRYYSTLLVDNVKTDNDKRILTSRSTEMLCLAEGTFDEVLVKNKSFSIYQNAEQGTGIIYDEDAIDEFKNEAIKLKKPMIVYVFSYDHNYNEEDFEDLKNLKTVKPVPEVILNVYRKIYKDLYKPRHL